jgi:hypothetical protein
LEDKFKTENVPAIAVKTMKFDCSGLAPTVRIVHILVMKLPQEVSTD